MVRAQVRWRETFSTGHTITDHVGKCRHLHGHNYRLQVTLEGDLDDMGMVIDFSDLKAILKDLLDRSYDHHFLIWIKDPRAIRLSELDPVGVQLWPVQPTAENIAVTLRAQISEYLRLAGHGHLEIVMVSVSETDNADATA